MSTVPTRCKPYDYFTEQPPLRKLVTRAWTPTAAEWQQVQQHLNVGDPLMDDWVHYMLANPKGARALFMQALDHGIANVDNPPEPLLRLFTQIELVPQWLDHDLLNEGCLFIHRTGSTGQNVLRDLSLMVGYLLSDLNQTLVLTGALVKGTQQRLAETTKWWMDVTEVDGLKRFGAGFKSTVYVRMVHSLVRLNVPKKHQWQGDVHGLPLNQIDLAMTNIAFVGLYLLGLRAMGTVISPKESKAAVHLWRYTGHVMGIMPQWLPTSETEALKLLYWGSHTYSPPDESSQIMGHSLAQEPMERVMAIDIKMPLMVRKVLAQYHYHKHLSITALFTSPRQRTQLGLPALVLPWYPALRFGPQLASSALAKVSSRWAKRITAQGRQQQILGVKLQFATQPQGLIKPKADHPAAVA